MRREPAGRARDLRLPRTGNVRRFGLGLTCSVMRSLAIIASCYAAAGCDYRGDAATGAVLEVENFRAPPEDWKFKPIQGAEVFVYWEGSRMMGHSILGYCLASVYATSDAQGTYFVQRLKISREVSGIGHIVTVSRAYVPGFVELRPDEHSHPIFTRWPPHRPSVHVFRKAEEPGSADRREAVFSASQFCPSDEFLEATKR